MEYTREWLLSRTLWPEADLDAIIETLEGPAPQVVLAGPPGTGKTWVAKQLVTYLTQGRAQLSAPRPVPPQLRL